MTEMILFLSVIALYPVIALVVTWKVARWPKRVSRRIAAGLLSLSVFMLIPTWDEIVGRLYLRHLCETEAGINAYKRADLSAAYWDEKGFPDIRVEHIAPGKSLDMVGDKYYIERIDQKIVPFLRVRKIIVQIKHVTKNDIISEQRSFRFWHGWVANSIGIIMPSPLICEARETYAPLLMKSFRRIK